MMMIGIYAMKPSPRVWMRVTRVLEEVRINGRVPIQQLFSGSFGSSRGALVYANAEGWLGDDTQVETYGL